jgi:hypothetical protein
VDGGGPLRLDGPITLCGRVDGDPGRRFTGAMSQLVLFDQALAATEVWQLYVASAFRTVDGSGNAGVPMMMTL